MGDGVKPKSIHVMPMRMRIFFENRCFTCMKIHVTITLKAEHTNSNYRHISNKGQSNAANITTSPSPFGGKGMSYEVSDGTIQKSDDGFLNVATALSLSSLIRLQFAMEYLRRSNQLG